MSLKLSQFGTQSQMQLAPVAGDENDELLRSIQEDPFGIGDDNRWDLREEINPDRLEAFLDEALRDQNSNTGT